MIRKLLFVIGLLLAATPALAQNTQCPNRPAGDNSNACANTRFVQDATSGGGALPEPANTVFAGPVSGSSATPSFRALVPADLPGAFSGFANPTATVGLTAKNGTATTAMRSDGAPAFDPTISPTVTGTWNFTNSTTNSILASGRPLWTDTTSVSGDTDGPLAIASMWTSNAGTPGTALVDRFNRVFIGEATHASSDAPMSTPDWLESLVPATTVAGQLVSVSAVGELAIVGASRASDFVSISGVATGGAQGGTFYGLEDDTVVGGSIACGMCGTAIEQSGIGTAINQLDAINDTANIVDVNVFGTFPGPGSSIALLLTSGAVSSLSQNDTSAAITIADGNLHKSRKGILFRSGALSTALGSGGAGIAMDMADGQSIRWVNSSNVMTSEIWGSATNGLVVTNNLDVLGSGTFGTTIKIGTGGSPSPGTLFSNSNWGMLFTALQSSPAVAQFGWETSATTLLATLDASSFNLASGVYSNGGTAGVTCATVSAVTMTVKGGIVTHC